MNTYKVYHLGVFSCSFQSRDGALAWIASQPNAEDFEILDKSDFLN